MRYELFIGWRYLKAKTKMAFIPIITFISVAGVAVGVMALVVVISVMNGFDTDLRSKILGNYSHLLVEQFPGIPNYPEVIQEIEEYPGVVAAAPVHIGHALLRTADIGLGEGIRVKGIEPDFEVRVTDVQKDLLVGNLDRLKSRPKDENEGSVDLTQLSRPLPGVVLGKELAKRLYQINVYDKEYEVEQLELLLGERLKIISPIEEESPLGTGMRTATFEVVAIFDSGFYEYDSHYALIGLDSARYLFALDEGVRRIEIRLENLDEATDISAGLFERLRDKFGQYFVMQTWMQMNEVFFTALRIEKIAMFVILVLIILVAAFNIASTLIMVVMEKTRDIGILRSIGASRRGIMAIFMIEGVVIGFLGTFLGLAGGIGICLFLKHYGLDLPGHGSIYYIDKLPVEMRFSDISLVSLLSLLTCFLSSIYPAWQAAKMVPVEALRYE